MEAPVADGKAAAYERHQEWPKDVADSVARHLRPELGRALFLGCGTGVNDALPFARLRRDARVVASDVEPAFLSKLEERVRAERLSRVEVRKIDILQDLSDLGAYDLVTLFFVIHRVAEWRKVAAELPRLVAPGGAFYVSEFAGPDGVIYLSNENGGRGQDPIARLIRRAFELTGRFDPPLKSTKIAPFLEALGPGLAPDGHRDFAWLQSVTVAEMAGKIASGAYAPYFHLRPALAQLRSEFSAEWSQRRDLTEVIRVHRFRRV